MRYHFSALPAVVICLLAGACRGGSEAVPQPERPRGLPYEVRYQDLAYDSVHGVLGISFFDPLSSTVMLRELDSTRTLWTLDIVDTAALGDTSLVYDDNGDPHVSYFGVDVDGDGDPDKTELVGDLVSPGILDKFPLAVNLTNASVYYRTRKAGVWQDQEIVDNSGSFSQAEHTIHIDDEGRPYCIVSSVGTSGTQVQGVPAFVQRVGPDSWVKNLIPTPGGATNNYLDSVSISTPGGTQCCVAICDQLNNDLLLARGFGGTWNIYAVAAGDVLGYQSVFDNGDGTLGFSYMSSDGNRLKYGQWDGADFSLLYTSAFDETGYQSEITVDSNGQPSILSINRFESRLWLTTFTGIEFEESGGPVIMTDHEGSDALLQANTIHSILVDSVNPAVSIGELGGIAYVELSVQ